MPCMYVAWIAVLWLANIAIAVGFVSDVSSVGYIFDGGFVMAENYVVRYNLSLDRLTYEAVQTEGSVPTNKRAIMINRFDITITVAPASKFQMRLTFWY